MKEKKFRKPKSAWKSARGDEINVIHNSLPLKKTNEKFAVRPKHLYAMLAATGILLVMFCEAFGAQNSLFGNAYNNTNTTDPSSYTADWSSESDLLATAANGNAKATFNKDVLRSVAKASGYSSLTEMMDAAREGKVIDAKGFLTNPDDGSTIAKGIQIKFGSLYWTPVYLTKDKNGDVILDLMLSASTTATENGTTDDKVQWSTWYAFDSSGTGQNAKDYDLPANMYSTSYIRSYLMGTDYTVNTAATYCPRSNADIKLTQGTQSERWNTFLTSIGWDAETNSCAVLDTPSQVAYQETESVAEYRLGTRTGYNICPNDAYGTPEKGTFYNDIDYLSGDTAKSGYTDWKDDYLWLPSMAEAGDANFAGMWKLTTAQLSNSGGTWFRSGGATNASCAYALTDVGKYTSYNSVDSSYGVRPAIHLNLNVIAGYKTEMPTEVSVTYTGKNIEADDISAVATWYDPEIMEIAFPENCKNAGEYPCTVTIKDGSPYIFESGEKTAAVTLTIAKAPIDVVVTVNKADGSITAECSGMVNGESAPDLTITYYEKETDSETEADIPANTSDIVEPGVYIISAKLPDDYDGNYYINKVKTDEYILERAEFNGRLVVAIPVLKQNTFVYSGENVDIEDYFEAFEEDVEAMSGDLNPVDIGEYAVTVSIKDEENVYWSDGKGDNTNGPMSFTFTITHVKIDDAWEKDEKGIPQLPADEDKIYYVYYDEEDNPVSNDEGPATKDDLTPGETYKVVAVIDDEYDDTHVFESTEATKTKPLVFTVSQPVKLEVPVLENARLTYNGEEQTVILFGYLSEYMEYDPADVTKTDADRYVITVKIKDGVYAEWVDGPGTEREIPFEIEKAAIDSVWGFEHTAPDLTSLPEGASVAYIIKDKNGVEVEAEDIAEGKEYVVTAILSDVSAENYYFAETGTDRVLAYFIYYSEEDLIVNNTLEEELPVWSLLIIILSLIGGGIAWAKTASNIRENAKDRKNRKEQEEQK
jgi:hypothetical protein